MKILIDMNLSPDWVDVFAGHDITAVHWSKVGDPRAEDSELMSWARVNSMSCSRTIWTLARRWP
jgi:predicted nuclease of predicted toxin-antitoxin system